MNVGGLRKMKIDKEVLDTWARFNLSLDEALLITKSCQKRVLDKVLEKAKDRDQQDQWGTPIINISDLEAILKELER